MRGGLLSLIGLGILLLALWRAFRVRRDLAAGETEWERAVFGRRPRIAWSETPLKFWCAIMVNATIVILIALVAAALMRLASFSFK